MSTEARIERAVERSAPSVSAPRSRVELGMVAALWRRDMMRLARERSRWFGVVLQPVIFWLIIGAGMSSTFRLPGDAQLDYMSFFYPGVLVMVILFTTIFATISVIEDRTSGFLQAVLVAPGSRTSLALGKVLGVSTMALIQALLFLALLPLTEVSLGAVSWGGLALALILASVGLAGLNFAVAWVMRSTHAYHAIMSVVLLPLWVLSGAMFPAAQEHAALRWVMRLNPMRYAVDGARAALTPAHADAPLWLSLVVLTGFALAAVALATVAARRGGQR